jgi:hypothetical protein
MSKQRARVDIATMSRIFRGKENEVDTCALFLSSHNLGNAYDTDPEAKEVVMSTKESRQQRFNEI